jgi:hypothetical protein
MDVPAVFREARCARGRTLADIARDTRIPLAALAAIEAGLFTELPRGVYARAWIRSYAAALGLDHTAVLDVVGAVLPRADETLSDICRVRDAPSKATRSWQYLTAALIDALVVIGVNAVMWAISLPMCECSAPEIPPTAVPAMITLLMTTLTLYAALFAGISGRTAGTALLRLDLMPRPPHALTVPEITQRAASYLLGDLHMFARATRR